MRIVRLAVLAALLILLVRAVAQAPVASPEEVQAQETLQALRFSELPGAIPTRYVAGTGDRAAALQQSLQPAAAWFDRQLKMHVDMTLYVLDRAGYAAVKNGGRWPVPYSDPEVAPKVIVFPSHVEDLLGQEAHAKIPGEYITYHEAAHNYANVLRIQSGNAWVNELVANMFAAAYIHAQRTDLQWVLDGPAAHSMTYVPHYTSLQDLDYVYAAGVGAENYAWYQHQLEELAGYLVTNKSLAEVVLRLQVEFPATDQRQESLDEIVVHLDKIHPGAKDFLRPISGPSILPRLEPVLCDASRVSTKAGGILAVRNETGAPLTVTSPSGISQTLAPGRWREFFLGVGEELKLTGGNCLVAGPEPMLAIVRHPSGRTTGK